MIQDIPYFMINEAWWYYDWKEWKYKLTSLAPQRAIESYKEFYNDLSED